MPKCHSSFEVAARICVSICFYTFLHVSICFSTYLCIQTQYIVCIYIPPDGFLLEGFLPAVFPANSGDVFVVVRITLSPFSLHFWVPVWSPQMLRRKNMTKMALNCWQAPFCYHPSGQKYIWVSQSSEYWKIGILCTNILEALTHFTRITCALQSWLLRGW